MSKEPFSFGKVFLGTPDEPRLGSPKTSFWKSDRTTSLVAAIITVGIGLLAGLIVLLFVSPQVGLKGFQMLVTGGFGTIGVVTGLGRVLYYSVPLIMCGLAVGFTLRANIFNIGVAGQYMLGMTAALFVGIYTEGHLGPFSWLVAICAGAGAGAIWGCLQGVLQAFLKINAIVCGIMLNYIAVFFANMMMENSREVYIRGRGWTEMVSDDYVIPRGGFDHLFGKNTTANSGIIICVGLCILAWWILKKTTLGYEIKAVGHNAEASRYAGISTRKATIISMTISGAFAGLGGAMNHLGASGTRYLIVDSLPSQGFTGISVALIAAANPIAIIFSGLLIAFFSVGGVSMQGLGLDPQMVDIITSVIIYCCAFSMFIRYLIRRQIKRISKRGEEEQNG